MIFSVFVLYLLLMLGIGLWAWRKTSSLEGFILGERSLGPIPTALSAGASDMSGWLLLGLPGYAFTAGFEAGWIALGLFIGTWANWRYMASPLRKASEQLNNSLTLPDYFANRFSEHAQWLRLLSAALILIFFLFYTSSGLVAGGKLFVSVLNVEYQLAVTVGLVIVVAYTMLGGFLAVTWTDVIQALLMLAALIAVPLLALQDLPLQVLKTQMLATNPELLNLFTNKEGEALGVMGIASLLAWGLGYFGQPHILARFMAIKNVDQLAYSRHVAVSWSFITLLGALCIGWVGIGLLPASLGDSEKIFIELIYLLTHPIIAGILLAAILAAIMSTADSQLLVASSALSNDMYKPLFKNASPKSLVWVGRFAVVAVALIAWRLALDPENTVLGMVSYAWAGFGAAFGPTLLLSLFWKPLSSTGAVVGIFFGALTVVVWKNLSGGVFELYEIIPGVVFNFIASILFSYWKPSPKMSKA